MKDTSPKMEQKFRKMLLERSGEERLKMGCSMHAAARALVKASISQKDPVAAKQALFLRFYGNDFGPNERKRILRALRKAAENNGKRKQLRTDAVGEGAGKYHGKTKSKAKPSRR